MNEKNATKRSRYISTMSELTASLTSAFNLFNEKFYDSKLQRAIITVKEGARTSAYGWIECRKNWKQGEELRHEINISCDYLNRPVTAVMATLLHEMAHLHNLQNDIKDTSRGGIYHNKRFKETAEAHGLNITFDEHIGWSRTTLKDDTKLWIEESIPIKGFRLYKTAEAADGKPSKPKQSMRKYVCPVCGTIIRATKEVSVICADCDEYFELSE